jgi:hypothetical protein
MRFTALMISLNWTAMPLAGAQQRTGPASLAAGTVLPMRLNDGLSSRDSQKGDTFTTTLHAGDTQDSSGLPDGTKIEGDVRSAIPQQGRDPGVLELSFQRLRLPNGRSYPIQGSLIGLDNKSVTRADDGRLVAKTAHRTDRLTYVGYGAGAGLIVGLLTRHPLEDVLLGGGLGYLFGALQKGGSEPRDVELKPGTEFGVRLDQDLNFSAYRRGGYRYNNGAYDNGNGYHRRQRDGDYSRDSEAMNDAPIAVLVDDRNVEFRHSARPYTTDDGVVMVPVGAILSAARVPYHYDGGREMLTTYGPSRTVRVSADSGVAVVNDTQRVRLAAPARLVNGSFYVPIRFLEPASDASVRWDGPSRTVVVTGGDR